MPLRGSARGAEMVGGKWMMMTFWFLTKFAPSVARTSVSTNLGLFVCTATA